MTEEKDKRKFMVGGKSSWKENQLGNVLVWER